MASARQGLKRHAQAIGFSLGAVLLSAMVSVGFAAAQCGPSAGDDNTACGDGALTSNTGIQNSAFGFNALNSNTTGYENTASGFGALENNTTGGQNTASGNGALFSNTVGYDNTAYGYLALVHNTTGDYNTAAGVNALNSNTTGYNNTASGFGALAVNTTGNDNTASGVNALGSNIMGSLNTASGYGALFSDTTGGNNTASGVNALASNTKGNNNTASGVYTLAHNRTGSHNIGLGNSAGGNIVIGSNNIDIGGSGPSDESGTIRIGTNGTQTRTFIAGISATQIRGNVVEVNSNGQLGIAVSSARYKRDIRDMGDASVGLMKLRPVSFRYKDDPSATLQYGLVAEEVARVYPEMVIRGTDGKVEGVRYLEFTALLLNELQKQSHETRQLADELKQKDASINALSKRLAALEQQMRTANSARFDSLARK